MRTETRLASFGFCTLLVVGGAVAALAVGGVLGAVLAFVLIATGLVLATSLVFLEVGMSEDRDRSRELERRASPTGRRPRFPRLRSHRREIK
jgi:hypothetical protein